MTGTNPHTQTHGKELINTMAQAVKYLIGDTREQIATIADGSVSLVACSPPFIALRSYLPAEHPDKNKEIGSEPDPATFLDTLLQLTAEWGRVLTPWGSIAIELGDTYAGGSAQGTDQNGSEKYKNGRGQEGLLNAHTKSCGEWPRPKCLALVPQLYAASLAYGRNLLTGEPSPAGQWLVRNMIVWHRPNPAVGALGDKYRPSTSYITVATRSPKRWFDLTAVRGEPVVPLEKRVRFRQADTGSRHDDGAMTYNVGNPAGAPPLDTWFDTHDHHNTGGNDGHDTWTLTTQPSSLAHYAMWPAKLAERLVLSMCPLEVCGACGEPRRRVEKVDGLHGRDILAVCADNERGTGLQGKRPPMPDITRTTTGWTDCGHNNYQPGTVLDPFAGTGTTLAVAALHGRNAIGIDIDSRNADMYDARYQEVKRSLFGTAPELPGQEALFT